MIMFFGGYSGDRQQGRHGRDENELFHLSTPSTWSKTSVRRRAHVQVDLHHWILMSVACDTDRTTLITLGKITTAAALGQPASRRARRSGRQRDPADSG